MEGRTVLIIDEYQWCPIKTFQSFTYDCKSRVNDKLFDSINVLLFCDIMQSHFPLKYYDPDFRGFSIEV